MKQTRLLTLLLMLAITAATWAKAKEIKRPDTYNYLRGVEAMQNNDTDEALDYFNRELKEHPENGYAYFMLGLLRGNNEEWGRALTALDAAAKKIPKKDTYYLSTVYYNRAKVYAALEDTTKCLNDLAAAIKCDPEDDDYYSYRGQIYYELKQYDLSDADYRRIVELDQGSVMGYMGLGRNADARERYDEAIRQFDIVAKMHSDYSEVYAFRAGTYAKLKDWHKATDDIIKALDINNSNRAQGVMYDLPAEATAVMLTKLKAKSASQPTEASWPFYMGVLYRVNKQYPQAVDAIKAACDIEGDEFLFYQLAYTQNVMGNFALAQENIERALEMDSTDVTYNLLKAEVEYNQGRGDDAIATISGMIAQTPSHASLYRGRAWYEDMTGRQQDALDDYSTALALDPELGLAWCGRGRLLTKMGRVEEAKADLEKYLELEKDTTISKTYCYFYLGDNEKAVEMMNHIINDAKPGDLDGAYYNAACLYSMMGQTGKALEYLRQAFDNGYVQFAHAQIDSDLENVRRLSQFGALIEEYQDRLDTDIVLSQDELGEMVVTEVPFVKENGVCKVKCTINDLPLQFIFDTGAATVSISSVEATFMFKNGYLTKDDIRGKEYFSTATGEIAVGTVINLRKVQVGDAVLTNVQASVTNSSSAPLLLGQSVFQKLGTVELDNANRVLRLTYRKPAN